nr:BCCT family transporter [Nesterenkonia sp. PF2B19]
MIIMTLPPLMIAAVVVLTIRHPERTAELIDRMRTFVTSGFTWHFVLYSLIAVGVCAWLAISRHGRIRLGGPQARPEHSRFAWYSMLFGCGQGIGLIFWGIAQPLMLRVDAPLISGSSPSEGGVVWTYFHWGVTAWAMYCVVAVCLAYSHHNLGKTLTFREATVDILPHRARRPAGVVVELLAIIATVLGLATSFGFASMQFSAGLQSFTGVESGPGIWMGVILTLAGLTAISVLLGVNKGMRRISETNSVLSIMLMVIVFVFGPTVYTLSNLTQTFGSFITHFVPMSFWTEAGEGGAALDSWQDTWNGWWTVFIWCWVIAFSPFVAGFIARISRGRTIREFVLGVTLVPSLIVMIWVGIIGSAGLHYDDTTDRSISEAVAEDSAAGLFLTLDMIPVLGTGLLVIATILVATYYVTSLDAGSYALAEFVSAPKKAGPWFRVVLVASIGTVAVVLLTLGGTQVVDTVQTGTIIGAFPFSFVILVMIVNLIRRLRCRTAAVRRMEKEINDPRHRAEDDHLDHDDPGGTTESSPVVQPAQGDRP